MSRAQRVLACVIITGSIVVTGYIGASATTTGASATPAKTASGLAAAEAAVKAFSKPVTNTYAPGLLTGSVKGKKFVCVHVKANTGIQACNLFATQAALLGVKVKIYDGGETAEETTNLFTMLAHDDHSYQGLYVIAYPPSEWIQQFKAIAASGVKIVLESAPADPAWSRKSINIAANQGGVKASFEVGADWIVANSRGKADTLFVNIPSEPALLAGEQGFAQVYKANCHTCGFVLANLDGFDAIGTTAPGLVVSYLQAHPDIHYVFGGFGGILQGVAQAVTAAGITGIKFAALSGTNTNVEAIKTGTQAMMVAWPFTVFSYVAVDALARAIVGGLKAASVANSWNFPVEIITQKNISDVSSDGSVDPKGLTAYFHKLWAKYLIRS